VAEHQDQGVGENEGDGFAGVGDLTRPFTIMRKAEDDELRGRRRVERVT
jgi:hypothetical protein